MVNLLAPLFLLNCMAATASVVVNYTVPGVSNPSGYLVFEYNNNPSCTGSIFERRATALDTCLPPGLRGEPYASSYYIFTNNSEGGVDSRLYSDSECLNFRQSEMLLYNSCSTSGDAVFYTYSATLPEFTVDYAIVQQVTYANVSDTEHLAECDIHNSTVTTYALYSNTCTQNCFFNNAWNYCTFDQCMNSTAHVTYFESSSNKCDQNDTVGGLTHMSICDDRITCYVPPLQPSSDSGGSSDDNSDIGLSLAGMIGIVVACVVVAVVVATAPDWRRKRRAAEPYSDMTESLTCNEQ